MAVPERQLSVLDGAFPIEIRKALTEVKAFLISPVASKTRGEPLKVMLPDGYYYYNYPCTPPPFFWDSGFRLGLMQR
jgi:hypothetical protein